MGAIGNPKTWVMGGAGTLAGFVGSAALPQMILGAGNTGVAGYAATAGAAIGLGLLSHFLLPRMPVVTAGVIAGAIPFVSASYGFEEATGEVRLKITENDNNRIEPNTVTVMLSEEISQKTVGVYLLDATTGAELAAPLTVDVAISM
jgi:hypothetical protein